MTIKIKIDKVDIDWDNIAEKVINDVGDAIVEQASEFAPVDTGNYRSQIQYNGSDKVIANASYSSAIEYGFEQYEETVKAHQRVITTAFGKKIDPTIVEVSEHTRTMNRKPNPVMRMSAREVQKQVNNIAQNVLKQNGIK